MGGRTGISETRLMVAVCLEDGCSSFSDGMAGEELLLRTLRSGGPLEESRSGVDFVSTSRGTSSVFSVLSGNMREPRSRGFPRVREWLGRDREFFDRVFRALMNTRAGRVGGSTMVTFFATWISAFSTEKMDDGDGERVLLLRLLFLLLVGGESGET